MDAQEWLLRRNCSLTPRQTITALIVLCALPFAVGMMFLLLHGIWIVLGFATAEISAAAAAFLHYARHATDREHIALADGYLLVEQFSAGMVRQIRLDPCWTRVTPPRHMRDMVMLEARDVRIEVGRFLTRDKRLLLAQELRQGLIGRSLI
jgi:uncharacterized membrane protein